MRRHENLSNLPAWRRGKPETSSACPCSGKAGNSRLSHTCCPLRLHHHKGCAVRYLFVPNFVSLQLSLFAKSSLVFHRVVLTCTALRDTVPSTSDLQTTDCPSARWWALKIANRCFPSLRTKNLVGFVSVIVLLHCPTASRMLSRI